MLKTERFVIIYILISKRDNSKIKSFYVGLSIRGVTH